MPLLLVREMCRYPEHLKYVETTLLKVCRRPDEVTEFVSLYWKDNGGKKSLPAQVKRGLAHAFGEYDAYQLAKYRCMDKAIKLRDVLRLCHPKPATREQSRLYKQLIENTLPTPDTWEVGLSAAKTPSEQRDVWTRLIESNKLPAFAMLKNLRNIEQVSVPKSIIRHAFANCKSDMLLPLDFFKAVRYAPNWTRELEDLMFRCAGQWRKLPGDTIFIVDVSGSMNNRVSTKSEFTRLDCATAMTVLVAEMCEHVIIYATAGSDVARRHQTKKIKPLRGFVLADAISDAQDILGGGGIFTAQVCDYVRTMEPERPDRIVIFSDSQDMSADSIIPRPHGHRNYICDVSCNTHGVNYRGAFTAEIAGWSDKLLQFIAALEQKSCQQ